MSDLISGKKSSLNQLECLSSHLVNLGIACLASSANIFCKGIGGSILTVVVYVDDLLIIGYDEDRVLDTEPKLVTFFKQRTYRR